MKLAFVGVFHYAGDKVSLHQDRQALRRYADGASRNRR